MLVVCVCVNLFVDDGGWGWGKMREVDKWGFIIVFNVFFSSVEFFFYWGFNFLCFCWLLGVFELLMVEI